MSLLKKFLSYFREEIEIIEEEIEVNEIKGEKLQLEKKQAPAESPSSAEKSKQTAATSAWPAAQQLSTRVAYRYPTLKRSDLKELTTDPRPPRWSEREVKEAEPVVSEKSYQPLYKPAARIAPRPFTPTDIPSPIYGFRDRPLKKEEKAVLSSEREWEGNNHDALLLFPKEQPSRPAEFEKPVRKESLEQKTIINKVSEKNDSLKNESDLISASTRTAQPRERRHSPFNVIMLKKDREKLAVPALKQQPKSASQEKPAAQIEKPAIPLEKTGGQTKITEKLDRPPLSFLTPPAEQTADDTWVKEKAALLNETLKSFNIDAEVTGVTTGPSITRFEVTPAIGVKVSKIVSLTDDIKRSLAARTIRIEAPIPGTQVVGIELPNDQSRPVFISEIIRDNKFQSANSPLASALGLDIAGNPVVLDLQKMPHGLIAGATGSGKSVCINSILVSLLYKAAPHELKLLLIDPKMVELTPYNGIPHLASPVITDVKAATAALKWAVEEMERRYQLFVHAGVRDMASYNAKVNESEFNEPNLPYLVIVIDELADLMMMAPGDVEESICRIAQKARACGIHLIVATQRPSVDVITGLIKANIPTRIAFSVSSQIDSRTILDKVGAEKLLGKGDMLFLNNGANEAVRLQGTFVTNEEIDEVVRFVSEQQKPDYLFKQEELLQKAAVHEEEDELFQEACELVVRQGGASTSMLQRHLKVGYNRAARLIEMMEAQGLVSGQRAGRPREVLLSEEEFFAYLEELN